MRTCSDECKDLWAQTLTKNRQKLSYFPAPGTLSHSLFYVYSFTYYLKYSFSGMHINAELVAAHLESLPVLPVSDTLEIIPNKLPIRRKLLSVFSTSQTPGLDESRLVERWPPGIFYEAQEEKNEERWPCEFSLNSRWLPLIMSTLSDAPASLHSFTVCTQSCDTVAGVAGSLQLSFQFVWAYLTASGKPCQSEYE